MSKEKGQGMTEYAIILALIIGIALAIYSSGSLQNAITGLYSSITTTMKGSAEENEHQAADLTNAKQLAKILNDAMSNGTIKFSDGNAKPDDWLELSVQRKQKANKSFLDGGANNTSSKGEKWQEVSINGQKYNSQRSLWTELVNKQLNSNDLRVQQKSNDWYGVRVYGDGHAVYYTGSKYNGTTPDFDSASQTPLSY